MLKTLRMMVPVLLLGNATATHAFEPRWTAGLDLFTERLTGKTGVNGVLFRVERATGRDVPVLAERMLGDWRLELGADRVLSTSEAGWKLFSRIHLGKSEVVQWRGVDSEAELIWSLADLQQTGPVPLSLVPRPPGCSWMPAVHGSVQRQSFVQITGYCQRAGATVFAELRQLLTRGRWTLRQTGPGLLQAEHGAQKMQIALTPAVNATRPPATNVVILELGIDPGRPP